MATQPSNSQSPPAGVSQQFSSLPHTHTVRQMKEYVLTDAELYDIALMNTLASSCFSVASGAFLFAVGLYTSAIMQGTLSERAEAFAQFGEWVGIILAVVFAVSGFLAWNARRGKVSAIKSQSVAIDQMRGVVYPQLQSDMSNQPIHDKANSQP